MFRNPSRLEVFLVHPGGPFWKSKDDGAWSIPKGEPALNEAPLAAAIREFREETGCDVSGNFIELPPITQKAGKRVLAWALEGNIDETNIVSNTFSMEWPPRSGKQSTFPEIDKGQWFTAEIAMRKMNPAQTRLITALLELL